MATSNADALHQLLRAVAKPSLPKYDGTKPIESFLSLLTHAHKELNEDEARTIRLLKESLDGDAMLFFTQMLKEDDDKDETATLDDWIVRLRDRFKKSFELQYAELKGRKMRTTDTASSYVDTVVSMAKGLNPPMIGMQLIMLLHENLLPKYRQTMRTMYPKTTDEFKEKLGFLMMTGNEDEEQMVDKLTEAISKATAAAIAKQAPKTETGGTTLAVETYDARDDRRYDQSRYEQHDDRGRRDYQNYDNSYRGNRGRGQGSRGRGRGRGRGYWQQQNYNSRFSQPFWPDYGQGYGYQPRFYQPAAQWPAVQYTRPAFQTQWPQNPQYQTRQSAPQRQGNSRFSQHQAYMVEHPATCPPTPMPLPSAAAHSSQATPEAEVAQFFAPFPENQ